MVFDLSPIFLALAQALGCFQLTAGNTGTRSLPDLTDFIFFIPLFVILEGGGGDSYQLPPPPSLSIPGLSHIIV